VIQQQRGLREQRGWKELRGYKEVGFGELEELANQKLSFDFFLYNIIIRNSEKIVI
jgi:hypothetical protein